MKGNSSGLMEAMCAAVEIKEKMKSLYEEAAGRCSDKVGSETFRMLRETEEKHLNHLREIYAELAKENGSLDSCRFYDFKTLSRAEIMKQIGRERKLIAKACLDDVAAVNSGMELENKSIEFFEERLRQASNPVEREFLNRMISEERSHYILLADVKFYYLDPEHWFMEKSRAELDGAGMAS